MISVPSLEKMLLHRESLLDDESGMTVDLAIYSADAKASTKTTPLILYVVGTAMPRVGTDSDETILSDLLGRGYLVAVLDYLGDGRSVTPVLEWSVQRMKMHFLYHPDFYGRVLSGVEYSKKAA